MGLLEWTGGDVLDPSSWKKLPRPIFTGGGHGCFIDAAGERRFVYHRKLSVDPGWADREIRSEPFTWDAHGYPLIASQRNPADLQLVGPKPSEAASPTYEPGAIPMFGTRVPT